MFISASSALQLKHPLMKLRPLTLATKQTKLKAKRCTGRENSFESGAIKSSAASGFESYLSFLEGIFLKVVICDH